MILWIIESNKENERKTEEDLRGVYSSGRQHSLKRVLGKLCTHHALEQRFSNYGPRITCGPRDLLLWSFKKYRRKTQIQMNCVSHYSWESQSLEMRHGNHLSIFLLVLTFYEIYYHTLNRFPILLSATKEGFKDECDVSRFLFPVHLAPHLYPAGDHPKSQNRTNVPCIYDILNSFAYFQSAHWNGHVLYVVHQ